MATVRIAVPHLYNDRRLISSERVALSHTHVVDFTVIWNVVLPGR